MNTFNAETIAENARAEAAKLTAVAAGAWHRFDRAQEIAQEIHLQVSGVALGLTPAVLAALDLARGTAETEATEALRAAEAAERAAMLAHVSVDKAEAFAELVKSTAEAAEAAEAPAEVVTMPEADYWALVANATGVPMVQLAEVAETLATEAEVFGPVSVTRSESHRFGPVTVTLGDELSRVTGLLGHLLARPVTTRRPVTAVVDGLTVTVPGWAADLFRALMAGRWL